MVASIITLGTSQRSGGPAFDGGYFLNLANPDYYTAGGEPPGRWYGAGAEALGMTGIVDAAHFQNLLAGNRPDGSSFAEPTTGVGSAARRRRTNARGAKSLQKPKKHVPAYDLCFSSPKSVSALWAAASVEQRRQIELSLDVAVTSTLDWLSANVPLARRGKGGRTKQAAELVIAQFDHGTSRVTQDGGWEPQLHRHCVVLNVARGTTDGRWSAVNSRLLHEWTRTLGPIFRATLAEQLRERLGLDLTRPRDARGKLASWFEIAGVPRALCQRWSSRRSEIEELLAGTAGGLGKWSNAKAREAANLKTRNAKPLVPPRGQLLAEWSAVAAEAGLTKHAAQQLTRQAPAIDAEQVFRDAWKEATGILDASQATFTYREALQRVCEAAQAHGVSGGWIAKRLTDFLNQSPEIRLLGNVQGEMHYATETMWKLEQQLLSEVETLRRAPGAKVPTRVIDRVIAAQPTLLDDQRAAIREILADTSSLRLLAGVAGAGKSFALDTVRAGFEQAGYRVIGGAIAGVAKEELAAKAGIDARTVASYLYHWDKSFVEQLQERIRHDLQQLMRAALGKPTHRPSVIRLDDKTVLVIDEAGMLDTQTTYDLCRIVRERGGTIVLVGDPAQLPAIGAGGSFAHFLAEKVAARLTANLRQQDPDDRSAAAQLRQGEATAALDNYAGRERLTIAKDREQAMRQLVDAWTKNGGAVHPERHVVFTPTRAEAKIINRLAQAERDAAGQIDRDRSLRNRDDLLCRGDRVLFHKNCYADGIRNGYRGVVTQVDRFRGTLTIRLDGKAGREQTIRLRDYGPEGISLGYAMTTHKGQGQSVEHSYLLVGGKMTDREMAYVQATRGKLSTRLFVDEAHAGEDLKDLARAMARSRAKELAHAMASRATPPKDMSSSPERSL